MIKNFDEFLKTLDENAFNSLNYGLSETVETDISNISKVTLERSVILNIRLIQKYHEWLSEQLEK